MRVRKQIFLLFLNAYTSESDYVSAWQEVQEQNNLKLRSGGVSG